MGDSDLISARNNGQGDVRVSGLPREPIAIVGIGCRFPGGVNSPESFWQLLRDGVDAIGEIPHDRFEIDAFYDPKPATPGKIISRYGGFLKNVDQFDPFFFGISPREAERLDPQQRFLLEVSWEALEDAGIVPQNIEGSSTGVFVGMWINDFESRLLVNPEQIDFYMTTGSGRYTASGRVSNFLGLQGPSLTLDTACSSSLVAVYLGCQSLWSGECEMALAGGANIILSPHISIAYSQSNMLAPDGRCKFGDARANGYVRSEGAGMVVLKLLSRALADRDPIYAKIIGGAVNNDGRTSGSMGTPGVRGQEDVLRKAYRSAGISPGKVQYVEAHGTGTRAGDPVELQALANVLKEGRPEAQPCVVGSVKTNIGHVEGAAGVAGLIKAALCLKHRGLPATLHFQTPNPSIPWDSLPLVIYPNYRPWPAISGSAIAGVNSFGIAGTNAHLVLEEAPVQMAEGTKQISASGERDGKPGSPGCQEATGTLHLLPLSAHTSEALEARAEAIGKLVRDKENQGNLEDLCYTASLRRAHHEFRLAVVGRTSQEFSDQFEAFLHDEARPGLSSGRAIPDLSHKVVFVFPGQGSQWVGMGRELLKTEAAFGEMLERCEAALQPLVDWSLMEQLTVDENSPAYRMPAIDVIQPVLLSIEIALAALWRSRGIEPDAVIGHSMGEAAASFVAGAISLDEALRIVCYRSRLMRRASGQGAMALVELSTEEVQRVIHGYEDRLSIAVYNSPTSNVLAGDPAALNEVLEILQKQNVFCRPIKVDVASHSPQMDPLKEDLVAMLGDIRPRKAAIPIYSTVLGTLLQGLECDARYWGMNLRQPVRFSEMVQKLLEDKHDLFIEMSPHPILLAAIGQGLEHSGYEARTIPSMIREQNEQVTMLGSLGELYTWGYPLDWMKLYPDGGTCVSLPVYPWQRESFWYGDESRSKESLSRRATSVKVGTRVHPFLDSSWNSSVQPSLHFWEGELSLEDHPYLSEHRVRETVIFPAAAIVETVLAAARETFKIEVPSLEGVLFENLLDLSKQGTKRIQIVFDAEVPEVHSFRFLSMNVVEPGLLPEWTLHARGSVRFNGEAGAPNRGLKFGPEDLVRGKESGQSREAHYEAMSLRGLNYGPAFQRVEETWQKDRAIFARLSCPNSLQSNSGTYRIHPTLLDACFQLLVTALSATARDAGTRETLLPVELGRIRVFGPIVREQEMYGCAIPTGTTSPDDNTFVGDVYLLTAEGQVVMEAVGLCLKRIERDAQKELQDRLYQLEWQPGNMDQREVAVEGGRGKWLIFADQGDVASSLASLLEAQGGSCTLVRPGESYKPLGPRQFQVTPGDPGDTQRLLDEFNEMDRSPWGGIIHMWSLDFPASDEISPSYLDKAERVSCISVLHLIQALARAGSNDIPRLWLITRGAQKVGREADSLSIAQSSLWGLGRVIPHEHPELHCSLIDLGANTSAEAAKQLANEIAGEKREDQVAFRGLQRYVARFVRFPAEQLARASRKGTREKFALAGDEGYRLEIDTPGILDDLTLRPFARRSPGRDEIEVRVHAAGLNFLDVMKTLGIFPGAPSGCSPRIGIECAGRVVAVGDGVREFHVGDDVICLSPSFDEVSCFSSYVTVPMALAVRKPPHLSDEDSAALPAAFLTASYALRYLGRMTAGERVLIHSAAGGVGLAAVQLAQHAGAEIFATAGSPEKREFLKGLGIRHVMDSRSLAFAEEVIEATAGQGVDIILNSLVGEAMAKSLALLKPFGRFLEIGKKDIYQDSRIGLGGFKNNLSYFAIDLAKVVVERAELVSSLFREIISFFGEKTFPLSPTLTFPASEAAAAFRCMAQARHIGKIVIQFNESKVMVESAAGFTRGFQPASTYLITGGLGGLGLKVAQWLIERGARHLALVGRTAPSAAAQRALDDLRAKGGRILVAQGDVAQEADVARVLDSIRRDMPELRGIIHAAGVLDDATLLTLDADRFHSTLAPKTRGAWNLHSLSRNDGLDFFVLFSSVASLLGLPGQGNYAAANAFLDGLAHYRRSLGKPALSINWGPWSDVGLASLKSIRGDRLASRGLESLSPQQGIAALEKFIDKDVAQIAVMSFDWERWQRSNPGTADQPYFDCLASSSSDGSIERGKRKDGEADLRDLILAAEAGRRRRSLLENHLQRQVAQVLKLPPPKVSLNRPLKTLGLDSLMSLELRNRLEASLGLKLSATLIWNYPTIELLSSFLDEEMEIQMSDASAPHPPKLVSKEKSQVRKNEVDQILAEIEELSDEDARRLLENKD
jgi:acyl transferase domain-containing protein/acyl carrier protein